MAARSSDYPGKTEIWSEQSHWWAMSRRYLLDGESSSQPSWFTGFYAFHIFGISVKKRTSKLPVFCIFIPLNNFKNCSERGSTKSVTDMPPINLNDVTSIVTLLAISARLPFIQLRQCSRGTWNKTTLLGCQAFRTFQRTMIMQIVTSWFILSSPK